MPAAVDLPSSAVAPPPWIEMPFDLTANILQRLGVEEILRSAQNVCATWWKVCHDPAMWRVVDLKCPCYPFSLKFDLMCRRAVDRSQGQLIDLTIAFFGNDDVLNYVADRSSNLCRLTLADPCGISGQALAKAVKKLPQLEELHLIMMPYLYANNVETIGISCPMLKSFSFIDPIYSENYEFVDGSFTNEYGLAIGKNMSNLLHLRVSSHLMKNKGLEAILEGCPHLESLDLRQCFSFDLRGGLGERCFKQIKDLRLPSDSVSVHEWPIKPPDDHHNYSHIDRDFDFEVFNYV